MLGQGLNCGQLAFIVRSCRKELRFLTNVRTLFVAPSFVTSIKGNYLKLKCNTPRVPPVTVKPNQAMAKGMPSGAGCAMTAPHTSPCVLTHDEAW